MILKPPYFRSFKFVANIDGVKDTTWSQQIIWLPLMSRCENN